MLRRVWPVIVLMSLAGCDSSGPASPSPTPTSLTVTLGLSSVFTGHTTTATATAKKSDGTTEVVGAAWSSDRTSVATVSSSGLVTAVGAGTANIIANYQGLTGSAPFSVTPDFSGTWTGTAALRSCEGFLDPRTCNNFVPEGSIAEVRVVLSQDGVGVRGSLDLRTVPPPNNPFGADPQHYIGEVSGSFDSEGVLSLQGPTKRDSPPLGWIELGIVQEWRTRVTANGQEGSFSHVFPSSDPRFRTGKVNWTAMNPRR